MTIKQSPVILFWTFVAIEILGFVFYSLAATLGNYKYELYSQLPFSAILSYQLAKLILLFGAQLAMTLYAFLRWHLETYILEPGLITHEWGVFIRKKKSIPLRREMSAALSSGPLEKLLHYGKMNILDANAKTVFTISRVSNPAKYLRTIEKYLGIRGAPQGNLDIHKLIAEDEHEQLEFKSSFRFDLRSAQANRDLEKAAMKTVAGFLNSKGGNLVIGVGDLPARTGGPADASGKAGGREPIGLNHDYQTLKRPTSDGFENHFTQVFNAMIGPEFRHLVKLRFPAVGERELCVVSVAPSPRPIYLKLDDNEHFYVRTGNITTPLKMSEVESYARSRWVRRTS